MLFSYARIFIASLEHLFEFLVVLNDEHIVISAIGFNSYFKVDGKDRYLFHIFQFVYWMAVDEMLICLSWTVFLNLLVFSLVCLGTHMSFALLSDL